jgi:hypothetical protein
MKQGGKRLQGRLGAPQRRYGGDIVRRNARFKIRLQSEIIVALISLGRGVFTKILHAAFYLLGSGFNIVKNLIENMYLISKKYRDHTSSGKRDKLSQYVRK